MVDGCVVGPAPSPLGEVAVCISLKIQQSGQVCVVELHRDGRAKKGFSLQRDAQSGGLKHRQIVGAVADAGGLGACDPETGTIMVEEPEF